MPSRLHETLARLSEVANDSTTFPTLASLIHNVKNMGSSGVQLGLARRSPDGSFRHDLAPMPSVIIEVSYS